MWNPFNVGISSSTVDESENIKKFSSTKLCNNDGGDDGEKNFIEKLCHRLRVKFFLISCYVVPCAISIIFFLIRMFPMLLASNSLLHFHPCIFFILFFCEIICLFLFNFTIIFETKDVNNKQNTENFAI